MKHASVALATLAGVALWPPTPFAAEPTLDPTFGTNGVVRTSILPGYADTPYALLVQPDDRILTAGISDGPAMNQPA